MATEPNIIIVTLHDLGRHLACYDVRLPWTVNISRLAAEGAVFENHFATCPLCSPSRASILTGRYPHNNGMNGLTHRGFGLNSNEKSIPHYLSQAGYHTALFGLQHETEADPAELGYAETSTDATLCLAVIPRVVEFLRRGHSKPFFLSIGFEEVHRHFKDMERMPIDPASVTVPAYLPDCSEVREDLADFYGLIQIVDQGMEQLLDVLETSGLSENTLVLFTTDHGAAFPRAKSTLYDAGIGVSLLVRWPAVIKPASRIKAMTSHIDILPTILEIVGAETPGVVQGQSFFELLSNPEGPGRDYVYAEKSWHGNEYDPMRCIRTQRWKYIVNFVDGYLYQSPRDIKSSPSGRVTEQSRRRPRPKMEMYDLTKDPDEFCNLAGSGEVKNIQAELDDKLFTWMRNTNDPLPDKHVPYPIKDAEYFLNNMDDPAP